MPVKHGMHRHPVYHVYSAMIQRCHNPNNVSFKNYGGRGIEVCDQWRFGEGGISGFECFFSDLGDRPSQKHTLERKDNDLGYNPDNCCWVTRKQQQDNIRSNVKVDFSGERINLSEMSRRCGIHRDTLNYRIFVKGWSPERAASSPLLRGISQ
jgi:hypothetical protein